MTFLIREKDGIFLAKQAEMIYLTSVTITEKVVLKIEKGVPLTDGDPIRKGRNPVYPLREMVVGDSFLAPRKRVDDLRKSIMWIEASTQSKFLARQFGADVRVWRVA